MNKVSLQILAFVLCILGKIYLNHSSADCDNND